MEKLNLRHSDTIAINTKEISLLNEQITELNAQNKSLNKQNNKLQIKITDLENVSEDEQNGHLESSMKVLKLESTLEEKRNSIDRLEDEVGIAINQRDKSINQKAKLEQICENLEVQ